MTELENLELQLKQLEVQKRTEEINQLRNTSKVRWATPAALAAFLPLVLWGLTMAKEYTAGIRALGEVDSLKAERSALAEQKRDLNEEIVALLALKQHYREEARAKQDAIDRTYLRGKFTSEELMYALDLMKGMEPVSRAQVEQLQSEADQLPPASRSAFANLLNRYELADIVITTSGELVGEFHRTFDLVAPSDWTKPYRGALTGQFADKRRLLVADVAGVTSYYDIDLGRTLTADEAQGIR